jgi:hypothetical protein
MWFKYMPTFIVDPVIDTTIQPLVDTTYNKEANDIFNLLKGSWNMVAYGGGISGATVNVEKPLDNQLMLSDYDPFTSELTYYFHRDSTYIKERVKLVKRAYTNLQDSVWTIDYNGGLAIEISKTGLTLSAKHADGMWFKYMPTFIVDPVIDTTTQPIPTNLSFISHSVNVIFTNECPAMIENVSVSDDHKSFKIKFDRKLSKADINSLPFNFAFDTRPIKSSLTNAVKTIGIDPSDSTILVCELETAMPDNSTIAITYNGTGLQFTKRVTTTDIATTGNATASSLIDLRDKHYPNPTHNQLSVITTGQFDEVTVLGYNGRIVQNIAVPATNQASIDLSVLEAGLYIVQCTSGGNLVYTGRFTKK